MQEVIGVARDASPLMNDRLEALGQMLEHYGELLGDLMQVQSEAGRQSMLELCRQELQSLRVSTDGIREVWQGFDTVLGAYKRKFKTGTQRKDAPGQMLFEGLDEDSGQG